MKGKAFNLIFGGLLVFALIIAITYIVVDIAQEEASIKEDMLNLGENAEIIQRVASIQEVRNWSLNISQTRPSYPIEYRLYVVAKSDISFTFRRKSIEGLLEDLDYFERIVNE